MQYDNLLAVKTLTSILKNMFYVTACQLAVTYTLGRTRIFQGRTTMVGRTKYRKPSGYDGSDLRCFEVTNAPHKNIKNNKDWFINHCSASVEWYCTKKGIPFKVLLVLKNAPDTLPSWETFSHSHSLLLS